MVGLPKTAWANAVFSRMADYIRNIYHRAIWEQSNSFVSVLIPLWGLKTIDQTVLSVSRQRGVVCEVLILRNGIQTLPQGIEEEERDYVYPGTKYMVREVFIRKKGKGEALNTGIRLARSNLISVLDADCILDDNALSIASMHFVDKRVVAVGGRLVVTPEDGSFLETVQDCEYMKTFQLTRRLFALLNAQCLVSGAFGVFRKKALLGLSGYDIDTVGEDMELILRIQNGIICRTKDRIEYEPAAICHTGVPHSLKRLLRQRDRWQRGLMDCLIKHRKMISNPRFGLLGLVTMNYQFLVELLGPIFWLLYNLCLFFKRPLFFLFLSFAVYIAVQCILTAVAGYLDSGKNMKKLMKRLPKLLLATLGGMLLQIPINLARLYGMITFHWRRLIW